MDYMSLVTQIKSTIRKKEEGLSKNQLLLIKKEKKIEKTGKK